jgi:hypothetical protein
MFNYYTNQPLLDKGSRKPNKNLLNAYKSYNNSSVSKNANSNIPMNPKFAISILTNPRAHCKPAPAKMKIKNIEQPHYKSKSKYPSLMLTAINNKGKFFLKIIKEYIALRKDKKLSKILDLPISKYSKYFGKKSKSKSKYLLPKKL